jgi:hypothetical protein
MKKRKYYLTDQETGELDEVSKEAHDRYHAAIRQISRRLGIGKPFIMGTMSDPSKDEAKALWMSGPYKPLD